MYVQVVEGIVIVAVTTAEGVAVIATAHEGCVGCAVPDIGFSDEYELVGIAALASSLM